MQYGLRPLLLKTNFESEKVQDGKKIEFQLGDTATEAFGSISDSEMCRRETNTTSKSLYGINRTLVSRLTVYATRGTN